jgi:hypothetical protein
LQRGCNFFHRCRDRFNVNNIDDEGRETIPSLDREFIAVFRTPDTGKHLESRSDHEQSASATNAA